MQPKRRLAFLSFVTFVLIALAITASAQRRGRFGGFSMFAPPNPKYDGAFTFCRVMYRNAANGDGGGWGVDYPKSDINLSFRLSELTTTLVSKDEAGEFNHAVLRLTDPELFRCPFIMITEPGGTYLDEEEAKQLREYLLRGGFLWADDFWGEYAWEHWVNEIQKALPTGYPIVDLQMDHPIFHSLYDVAELPQIPSINSYFGTGRSTSERGSDSAVPHARAIFDTAGHMMVLMTHNTDFGDAFEREGENRAYFERFAGVGYAFGINALFYAMSH